MVSAKRFPVLQPIQAERLAGESAASAGRARTPLEVHPPAGVRAAVFQTPNPTITVIWLY
jgi:hypothetical protein